MPSNIARDVSFKVMYFLEKNLNNMYVSPWLMILMQIDEQAEYRNYLNEH